MIFYLEIVERGHLVPDSGNSPREDEVGETAHAGHHHQLAQEQQEVHHLQRHQEQLIAMGRSKDIYCILNSIFK